MSQISKALNKIQEARQESQEKKAESIVYLAEAPKTLLRNSLVIFVGVVALVAILISIASMVLTMKSTYSKQFEVLGLESTIKAEEKRINELVISINKNQLVIDKQIHDLNFNLKDEALNTKSQISNLAVKDNDHYNSLKDSIVDDKENITLLNKYINILNRKIEEISAKENQTKDLPNPASGI